MLCSGPQISQVQQAPAEAFLAQRSVSLQAHAWRLLLLGQAVRARSFPSPARCIPAWRVACDLRSGPGPPVPNQMSSPLWQSHSPKAMPKHFGPHLREMRNSHRCSLPQEQGPCLSFAPQAGTEFHLPREHPGAGIPACSLEESRPAVSYAFASSAKDS